MQASRRDSQARVLLVDDDDDLRDVVSSALERKGYHVQCLSDASAALLQLQGGAPPDVILLDLMMPGMTGWEFRVEQRRLPKLAGIPVVTMSASPSAQAAAIDADAFLHKPFDVGELLNAIEGVLVVAERKRLDAQVAEAERLRSLGLLAGGIAHEVNNPLTVVLGRCELALRALDELAPHVAPAGTELMDSLRNGMDEIARSAERISAVVRGVATLGKTDHTVGAVDVNDALNASLRLLAHSIRRRARLVLDLPRVARVRGNASQLVQVFVNLLLNALQAIPESAADQHEICVRTYPSGQDRVAVEISDDGCGMRAETAARAFEPFFTTKPVGSGMGLGLAICHRLITELGGSMVVTSTLGEGSCFRVELLVHEAAGPVTGPEAHAGDRLRR